MRTLQKPLTTFMLFLSACFLTSWNFNRQDKTFKTNTVVTNDSLMNAIGDFDADSPGKPPIGNVYIQKITDDLNHLLIIAQSKTPGYGSKSFELQYDTYKILFRDDGQEYDAIASDGYYTGRVLVSQRSFKEIAVRLGMNPNPPRYKYEGREIISRNTDKSQFGFNITAFENNQMVPITNLGITAASTGLIDHSLLITNLAVVEDSTRTWNSCTQKGNVDGPWTFKTIMKQLASTDPSHIANDSTVSAFVLNWLNTWLSKKIINGDTVTSRQRMQNKIIQPWLDKSFEGGAPAGQLDMRFAPFKLTAIVNRFDMRFNGTVSKVGQARIVFCLINSACTNKEEFNVIFEYAVPIVKCNDMHAYELEWYNLKDSVLGSPGYNAALQHITDRFTLCGTSITKPNQSSLNQIRTNEIAIAPISDQRWQLREFILDSVTHQLKQTTVKKEPQKKYNAKVDNADVQRMANFVNINSGFNGMSFFYPDSLNGFPFIAGSAIIDNPPCGDSIPKVYHWDGADKTKPSSFIVSSTKRQTFSQSTCSGCHSGETQTGFTQIDPVFFGKEATLSGFLSGKAGRNGSFDYDGDPNNGVLTVKDPAQRPALNNITLRTFNDLDRRATDLENFVATTCGTVLQIRNDLMFQPLGMTH